LTIDETSLTAANNLAIRKALEAAGVEFIDENGWGTLRSPSEGAKAKAVRIGDVLAKWTQFRSLPSASNRKARQAAPPISVGSKPSFECTSFLAAALIIAPDCKRRDRAVRRLFMQGERRSDVYGSRKTNPNYFRDCGHFGPRQYPVKKAARVCANSVGNPARASDWKPVG
jgi:hypothetical protein